jgi:hypothetical protein
MIQAAHVHTVPIPDDLWALLLAKLSEQQLSDWATETLVVEAAREHVISRRKAASLLGYQDYESREAFFERHQLFNEYTVEMLDEDFKTIDMHLDLAKQLKAG